MIKNEHVPIMVEEILSFVNGKNNLSILDCTFGGGGHSKKFLERGHFVTAIDQDDYSLNIAEHLKKKYQNISFYKTNFINLDMLNLNKKFDFILLDLGFSSNQKKTLYEFLKEHNFNDKELLESNVVKLDRNNRMRDFFTRD